MDHLLGLKENVIIGKLIPAGSGLSMYRKYDQMDDEGTAQSGETVAESAEVTDAAPEVEETILTDSADF